TQAIAVTVNNLNDNAPVITSNGTGATASVNIAENATAVTTVTATDADGRSEERRVGNGGADAWHGTRNAATGGLSYVPAPDLDTPSNASGHTIYVSTCHSSVCSPTLTQAIAVTVNNLNDNAPVITSNGTGATASVNIAENATAVTTVTATDADG